MKSKDRKSKSTFTGTQVVFLIACTLVLERLVLVSKDLGTYIRPETTTTTTLDMPIHQTQQRCIPDHQVLSWQTLDESPAGHNISTGAAATTKTEIGSSTYPYIPWNMLSKCGPIRVGNTSSMLEWVQPKPLTQSLGYIKPYKTGSSTVANLVNRWAESRDMAKIIPKPADKAVLGRYWHSPANLSETFPGKIFETVPEGEKYRAVSNHAVFFDRSVLGEYLEEPITTFTILRDPLSRVKSAYKYFGCGGSKNYPSWTGLNQTAKDLRRIARWNEAVCGNSMAYSLGWYSQNNESTKNDHDVEKIQAFIEKIDRQMDVVMILEKMEQSLLLLRDALPGISVPELLYTNVKENHNGTNVANSGIKKSVTLTESEMQELPEILLLDRMIYDHFKNRLDKDWESLIRRSPEIESMRRGLGCLQGIVKAHLRDEDLFTEQLREMLTTDSKKYTIHLKDKQLKRMKKQQQKQNAN